MKHWRGDATGDGTPDGSEPGGVMRPGRLQAVDALRALALLGILAVNVWFFAHPEMLHGSLSRPVPETAGDQLVRFISTLLFEAKAYVVFSFLFGLSFVLAWASAHRAGLSEVGRSVRRFVALIVLGVVHGVFLFAGDILLAYALLGFALLGMRRISVRWALILAGSVFVLWAGFTLITGALTVGIEGTDQWDASMTPTIDPDQARADYTAGLVSYLGFQVSVYPSIAVGMLFGQAPMAFGAFLVGLVVGRAQLLERIVRYQVSTPKLLGWMLAALAVGLGLSAAAAVMLWGTPGSVGSQVSGDEQTMGTELIASGLTFLAGPIQAAGYVILALLIFRSSPAAPLVRALAPAGRMSLSNYLSQSLVLAVIFSGLGFGLAGTLSELAVGAIVLALWLAQLIVSRLWFTRFTRGPLEQPVRAWTYAAG